MKHQLELGRVFIPQLEETLHTPRAVNARCPPAVLQVTTKSRRQRKMAAVGLRPMSVY